ncbi:MAG: phosphoglycerate mutase [Thermoleophilia bacterium]|nr:phosphoglycerate mutase [Thermoleophilia bacterium]
MRNIYVIPHTEATHHTERLVGGWYDSGLTPHGVRDAVRIAHALAARLDDDGSVDVRSSDLARARQTAQPIGDALGVAVGIDRDLREQSYGTADGTPVGSTPYEPPPLDERRMHHRSGAGAETRFEWATRTYAALDRILENGHDHTVVVTHGGTATYLIAAWLEIPIEATRRAKFITAPGSITHLREHDVSWDREVVTLNDIGHLRE